MKCSEDLLALIFFHLLLQNHERKKEGLTDGRTNPHRDLRIHAATLLSEGAGRPLSPKDGYTDINSRVIYRTWTALWPLLKSKLNTNRTRPIRPTLRLHVDGMIS